MSLPARLRYLRRVFAAYLLPGRSQLTFWHETPAANPQARMDKLGEYYMMFSEKADYAGPYDADGVPMLDYHGTIGIRHNPIAIAHWGLGNYNLLCQTGEKVRQDRFLRAAEWLRTNLKPNAHDIWVWNHDFDWEYRTPLKAPWYSGLAQGQGISLLVRAHAVCGKAEYLHAAERAFRAFQASIAKGGVIFTDALGDPWIEEYIVDPPTHILNGFLWASWGVHDYFLATGDQSIRALFDKLAATLQNNLAAYDLGFWSLYEQSGTLLPMVASPFYHRLHVVQLRIMHRMTGNEVFAQYADKWENYMHSAGNRARALCYKSAFKLCYY